MTARWRSSFAAAGLRNLVVAGAVLLIAEVARSRRDAVPPAQATHDELAIDKLDLGCSPTHLNHDGDANRTSPKDWVGMIHQDANELVSLSEHLS
jgi:hypothetical protein